MNEKAKYFVKGVGTGMIVGSAFGMAMTSGTGESKKSSKNNVVSKAFKTMGDIVENIGDSLGM